MKALEYFKKHPYAAGAALIVGLIVVYMLFRKGGSSSSGLAGLAAQQNQGQLQLAELNAQQSGQQQQLQAQLAATEYQASLSAQESQNQLVGSLADTIIPSQLQLEALASQEQYALARQQQFAPFISDALQKASQSGGGRQETGLAELGLLLDEGNLSQISSISGYNPNRSLALNLGNGLFAGGASIPA